MVSRLVGIGIQGDAQVAGNRGVNITGLLEDLPHQVVGFMLRTLVTRIDGKYA